MKRGYSPREERVVREKEEEGGFLCEERLMNEERMGEGCTELRSGSESSKVRRAWQQGGECDWVQQEGRTKASPQRGLDRGVSILANCSHFSGHLIARFRRHTQQQQNNEPGRG
jgi:hypothetical protein